MQALKGSLLTEIGNPYLRGEAKAATTGAARIAPPRDSLRGAQIQPRLRPCSNSMNRLRIAHATRASHFSSSTTPPFCWVEYGSA